MYAQLIHTRCGDGVNLLNSLAPEPNRSAGGFKTFSCSSEMIEDGFVDLQMLNNIRAQKQPFKDPIVMDDAYAYYVPDFGGRMLASFHPIHFDVNDIHGNYVHRPGNFINQVYVGPFEDFYPYETFGNDSVWDAKARGEAFYYENEPFPLPVKTSLCETNGYITLEDIKNFVDSGRSEIVKKAIAFIIDQYSQEPMYRKYLVIRDVDSKSIELWVAAIESAFSPRMASGLSFATRLDNYANSNRYMVGPNGQFQPQLNLQVAGNRIRFRAMIVGIDTRENASPVRALPNSPFVILDGVSKSFSYDTDISNPYFNTVISYDEAHTYFCRELMQMVQLATPSSDVYNLYEAWAGIASFDRSDDILGLQKAIRVLNQYQLIRTRALSNLYSLVKSKMNMIMSKGPLAAFPIANWMEKVGPIVGENNFKESINDAIYQSYADDVFMHPQSDATAAFHDAIRDADQEDAVSNYLIQVSTVKKYRDYITKYKVDDWTAFTKYFVECFFSNGRLPEIAGFILPTCLRKLCTENEPGKAFQIVAQYASCNKEQTVLLLLNEAEAVGNVKYRSFIVSIISKVDDEILSSNDAIMQMYKALVKHKLEAYITIPLVLRANGMVDSAKAESYLSWILSRAEFRDLDLTDLFVAIDRQLQISAKQGFALAQRIQNNRPSKAMCPHSAHIYAIQIMGDDQFKPFLPELIKELTKQGVPSYENDIYIESFVDGLRNSEMGKKELFLVMSIASKSPNYSKRIVDRALKSGGSKNSDFFVSVVDVASNLNNSNLDSAFVEACIKLSHFDKEMEYLGHWLDSPKSRQYWLNIDTLSRENKKTNRSESLFNRIIRGKKEDN